MSGKKGMLHYSEEIKNKIIAEQKAGASVICCLLFVFYNIFGFKSGVGR